VTEGYKELALGQTTLSLLLKTGLQFLNLYGQGTVFFGQSVKRSQTPDRNCNPNAKTYSQRKKKPYNLPGRKKPEGVAHHKIIL
jgi:hypothetical protein